METWVARIGVVASAALLAPSWAWSCPQCALRDSPTGNLLYYFLGAAVLFPYAIGAVAVHVIRKLNASDTLEEGSP